jgi:SAM-dependent methyltransferase
MRGTCQDPDRADSRRCLIGGLTNMRISQEGGFGGPGDLLVGGESLPLICPRCLRSKSQEQLLEPTGSCPCCGIRYQSLDEIPVLITDDSVRKALTTGIDPNDAGTRCYQEYDDYGRDHKIKDWLEHQHVIARKKRETIEYGLASATASGIVLEVGSGHGLLAGVGGADYVALDYSLGLLRTYLGEHRRVCANAETIPLASGSCRLVYSYATFEHVPRPDLAFAELHRVLAVGGVACLAPAWHCRDWAAEGLNVRPYRDLFLKQKIRKILVPLRNSIVYRGCQQIPWRIWRRGLNRLSGAPSWLQYGSLQPNYEHLWVPDSDACSSIDSHEGILFFDSRGYEILEPRGGTIAQLLFGGGQIIVRKDQAS